MSSAEALQQHAEWLRITLSGIGDAVIGADVDGRVTFLNRVAEEMTRWTSAEAVGRPVTEVLVIIDEVTLEPALNPMVRALQEGVVQGLGNHTILVARDGTGRPVDDSAAPMRDAEGAIIGAVAVFRDISERRRAERARLRSERELSDFFEKANIGIHWLGPNGVVLRANQAELDLLGFSREEYVGRHISNFHADTETVADILRRLVEGDTLFEYPARLRAKDGSIREVLISSNAFFEDGRFVHTRCFTLDVTARKNAETALRESEQRFQEIAQSVDTVFYVIDLPERRVRYVSPAFERLWGLSADTLYADADAWRALIHPDDLSAMSAAYDAFLGGGPPFDVSYRITLPDDSERWIHDRATVAARDSEGRISRITGLTEDITVHRNAEQILKDADRRKDEFLAILAHELRNPLAPVRNSLEVMKRANGDAYVIENARLMMERQVGQMVRLIDDLLDVGRITRNKLALRRGRVELASVIHQVVEAVAPAVEQAHQVLTVSVPKAPVYLDADPVRLAQVFGNLLNNACKYTDSGGHITLTVEAEMGMAQVSVMDTGVGIPSDRLPDIFEMFSQVDQSLERAQGGLGIGLTLVRRLVEMHGGTVSARSDGPGRGSVFAVRLPVLTSPPEPVADVLAPQSAPVVRRILVVDDNEDLATSMAMLLTISGSETETAFDGIEAIDRAASFRPDVVLLDIGLPRLNGYEVARRMRSEPWGASLILVAMTGWGQDEDRRKSTEAGFNAHLVKPVDHNRLKALLTELTSASSASRAVPPPSPG